MFVTFRMTAKKLFVITAAAIALVLFFDAARSLAAVKPTVCRNDTERVMYLKTRGITADPLPLWTKQAVIDSEGGDGWAEYAERLSRLGVDLKPHFGRAVTVYCYAVTHSDTYDCVRVLCDGDKVIGYEPLDTYKQV